MRHIRLAIFHIGKARFVARSSLSLSQGLKKHIEFVKMR